MQIKHTLKYLTLPQEKVHDVAEMAIQHDVGRSIPALKAVKPDIVIVEAGKHRPSPPMAQADTPNEKQYRGVQVAPNY